MSTRRLPLHGPRARLAAPLAAIGLLAVAPAGAQAAFDTFGSSLSVPASLETADNLLPQPHDAADTALWNATLASGDATVPASGQVATVSLEGCAEPQGGAPAPDTAIQFQDLRPVGGGSAMVIATAGAGVFNIPTCGGAVGASTVTTYQPDFLCAQAGDFIGFNDDGGFVPMTATTPAYYPEGVPYLVMAPVAGSTTNSWVQHMGTDNGATFTFGSNPTATSGFGVESGQELLMQVVLGTGPDADGGCGGTADAGGPIENAQGQITVPPTPTPTPTPTPVNTGPTTAPPPTIFKTADIGLVSGTVLVKVPATTASAAAFGPLAAQTITKGTGFVPLTVDRQIPLGSILDTRHGVVTVATATSATPGALQQFGNFSAGVFMLLQNRTQKGLTQLDLMDTGSKAVCASVGKSAREPAGASAATAAAVAVAVAARSAPARKKLSTAQLGKLTATATGMFETHGDYSAATVRGTSYTVTDQCDGTLTTVKRGMVLVRDYATHKTILLSTGHRFLAKAPPGSKYVTIGKGTPASG